MIQKTYKGLSPISVPENERVISIKLPSTASAIKSLNTEHLTTIDVSECDIEFAQQVKATYETETTNVIMPNVPDTSNMVHEIELWANPECTIRPEGLVKTLYVQLNTDITESIDFRKISVAIAIEEDLLDGYGSNISYNYDYYSEDYMDTYLPKGVYPISFGDGDYVDESDWSLGELVERPESTPIQVYINYQATSKVIPYEISSLPTITSHEFSDGKGVIKFATEVTSIGSDAFFECQNLGAYILVDRNAGK